MSDAQAPTALGPYSFTLTPEEAKTAASRAGLRSVLAGRLSRNHVAPLVAFALFVAFVVILTLTGLIARRFGEGALILAAIAFMAARMAAHWRLRGAQKSNLAAMTALQEAGQVVVRLDDSGLRMESAGGSRQFAFADCDEAEEAGGIIYLWRRQGAPAFIPAHAFAGDQAAQEFLAFLRDGIRRAARRQA
ncbi:hypothetical protein [Methylocapsa sp. S129]|uniref:hypothetical protein n=1 Tax=Methylocapsa sp. S129 TaxID=1641869 RepID=UPI00131E280A|nr:hypothetical protein [Methylocapsa sp. S129]